MFLDPPGGWFGWKFVHPDRSEFYYSHYPRFPGFRETELADMGLFQLLCTFLHVVVFTTINKTYLICPNEYEAKCVGWEHYVNLKIWQNAHIKAKLLFEYLHMYSVHTHTASVVSADYIIINAHFLGHAALL